MYNKRQLSKMPGYILTKKCNNIHYTENSALFIVRKLSGGGAERVTATLCNRFSTNNVNTYVLELDGFSDDYALADGVHHLSIKQGACRQLNILKRIRAINLLCKLIKPNNIIALGSVCKYLSFSSVPSGTKIILSERNFPDAIFTKKEKKTFEKLYLKADAVVFQTSEARDCYSQRVRDKGVIISNPLMPGLTVFKGERSKRIVTFARLEPQKNLTLLIDAFAVFHRSHPDWLLQIYGRGSQEGLLRGQIEGLDLESVASIFPFTKDIHNRICDAGMFVSSSDFEGLQNALMEAMAMGIPCVATDCLGGGARAISANGERALLVPRGDVSALINAMAKIADDSDLAQSLSGRGVEIVHESDEATVARKWLELIA